MMKQIELLKHHPDFTTNGVDRFLLVIEMNTINDDPPFLITLEVVDAADERRLARPRRSAQNDFLACADR